ncbi:MAG: FAD-dependent oxidoreductase [Alphaproteobacteria bacterium]|nr:FAD-dependent oxidoreductase [Alphaproteobacteria bacterium]
MQKTDIIIGGGFFGMYLAEFLSKAGHKVILFEKGNDFMQEASLVNQARIHQGYHYPRSALTALRSRVSYPRFIAEFQDCVYDTFEKYYLIGKILSKVTAKQYQQFCHRIGAECNPASDKIVRLTNPHFVEAAFETIEAAFDAIKLKDIMKQRLADAKIESHLNAMVVKVGPDGKGLRVHVKGPDGAINDLYADQVFNTTYADLNQLIVASGLQSIPLKYELTELCLVEPPDLLKNCGITVMCGPFFSVMPFPSTGYHSFTHVRYTPHRTWTEAQHTTTLASFREDGGAISVPSAWEAIRRDATRYLPILTDCAYQRSLWTVKTVLPRSERDDSRPILFKPNYGLPHFHCIMGGKIDNIYDVIDALQLQKGIV